jgi:aminocarboxymuconate-semialdehyde decarboxylase
VLAYLPLDEPEAAAAELDRCASSTGSLVGWAGSAGGGSLPLDDPRLAGLWARVAESGRPMLLHPGSSPDSRLGPHYLANLLGNPVETALAAAELVFGDVLGTHPALRLALVHCGGGVPLLAGRWQRGLDTARPGVGALTLGPREAVRRFWVDALAHDPAVVDLAATVIGEDKLVLGSDWPFPMGLDDPSSGIAHLAADLRDRIARDNALVLRGGGTR